MSDQPIADTVRDLMARGAAADEVVAAVDASVARVRQASADLMGMMAHDLRSPLSGLLGLITTMRRVPMPPETATEFLQRAERACHRLERLISDASTLAQLDAGGVRAQAQPLDLDQLLAEVLSTVHGDVTVRAVEPSQQRIVGDHRRLVQILSRILDNAVRLSPSPPVLSIRADDGVTRFTIDDDGPGIAEEEHDRVFDRFYQVIGPDQQGRSGLGLAIARELTGALGGRLTLSSALGQGTTFILELPAN